MRDAMIFLGTVLAIACWTLVAALLGGCENPYNCGEACAKAGAKMASFDSQGCGNFKCACAEADGGSK